MLLFDSQLRGKHCAWLIACVIATLAAIGFYAWWSVGSLRWPGGSSTPGILFGVLGGLIILFEVALWPRKSRYVRAWRFLGRTQHWMMAHIWLGLLSIPLVMLHTGFRWGGGLSTWLLLLYIIVVASGIFGLVMQNIVPRKLLHDVPAETIYSQIPHICRLTRDEADDLIRTVCGWDAVPGEAAAAPQSPGEDQSTLLLVGATRKVGRFQGRSVQTQVQNVRIAGADLVRDVYRDTIRPFLEHGPQKPGDLGYEDRAREFFEDLRLRLSPESHFAVQALEGWCAQRRQLHQQARLHWLLHGWLNVHLPLSVALLVLLAAHVFFALKYL